MKFFIFIFLSAALVHAEDTSILGKWLVGDKDAKVELYQNGENLEGKLVWLQQPQEPDGKNKLDSKNPEISLRSQQIQGMIFLKNFKKVENENKWTGGTVYDAKSGKTYSGWIKLIDEKKIELRGFVGISLFGRTDVWIRDLQ